MVNIFEISCKNGRTIHLSHERWKHISREHPEIVPYLEKVKETLKRPDKVTSYKFDKAVKYYYKHIKEKKLKYLLIIVKYLNGQGFVITSYFVRKIK